jgi:hypothetical protein
VVLGFTANVSHFELLESKHILSRNAGQPVRGTAAEASETEDDVVEIGAHGGKLRRIGAGRQCGARLDGTRLARIFAGTKT